MSGDSINKNNFNCNSVVSKKYLVYKTSKTFFGTTCTKKGLVWVRPRTKNNFFKDVTKADFKLSKTFYFIKISNVLAEF